MASLTHRARQWLAARLPDDRLLGSRALQLALRYRSTGSMVVDRIGELEIEYDYRSVIGSKLFRQGSFERREIAFFENLLRAAPPRPTILDIGANIGMHTMAWATCRRDATVHAFEPSPTTAAILERNVRRNHLADRVHIQRVALSDTIGTAELFECDDNAFSSLKDTRRKQVIATTTVPTTTLDAFVREAAIDRLALIKIDVEGIETQVIRGAAETLRERGPDLFVEIYGGGDSNPDPTGTIELIRSHGYEAFVLIEGQPTRYVAHDDRHYNYFFKKPR